MSLSSKEICVELSQLCEKKENVAFVQLFTKHPLFNCVIGADWGNYWGDPHEYHAYAFYLAYYYKNVDLLNDLIQIAESNDLLGKDRKENIRRARLYAAGASANLEDDFLQRVRRKTIKRWNWLYEHYLEGLWHAKHYKELAEELLSEKNRLWFAYSDKSCVLEDPGYHMHEVVKDEDFDRELPYISKEGVGKILISLACKLLWLQQSQIAISYLKTPSDKTEKGLDDEMEGHIGEF